MLDITERKDSQAHLERALEADVRRRNASVRSMR
jgi:hypothetical protein